MLLFTYKTLGGRKPSRLLPEQSQGYVPHWFRLQPGPGQQHAVHGTLTLLVATGC